MDHARRRTRWLAACAGATLWTATAGAQGEGSPKRVVTGYVVDVLQQPCAAARVEFFTAEDGRSVGRTTADGSGAFRCAGLPLGGLLVRATTERGRGQTMTRRDADGRGGGMGLHCVVEETQRVSGRVTDAAGRPLAGVAIVAAREYDALDHATSDAAGRYELEHVGLGDVVLRAWHPEHGMTQCPLTVLSDARRDLSLGAGGGTLRIAFKGRREALDAAARRSLWIRPRYSAGRSLQVLPEGLERVAGGVAADATCTLRGLPAGEYRPEVGSTAFGWSQSLPQLTLTEGATREVEVEVDPPTLGSAVAVRGTLQDFDWHALASMELTCGTTTFATDGAGSFELPEPRAPGSTVRLQMLDDTWTLGEPRGVTCRVGASPLRLQAERAAAVEGRVTTADGLPAEGVLVWLVDPETDRGVGHTETGLDGCFRLGHLAPAPAGLVARVAAFLGAGRPLGSGQSQPLGPLVAGVVQSGADIALGGTGALTGRALSGDGVPLGGAAVVARGGAHPDTGTEVAGRTDRHGSFRLVGLDPGHYEVRIRAGTGFGQTLGTLEGVTVEDGAAIDVGELVCEPRAKPESGG